MERLLGFSCVWALCGTVAVSAAVVQTTFLLTRVQDGTLMIFR